MLYTRPRSLVVPSFVLGGIVLAALAAPPAFLCQCPKTRDECQAVEDFVWEVGSYEFTGPSEDITVADAVSGKQLVARLRWTGDIDPARDFVVLSLDSTCSGSDSDVVAGLDRYGLGTLSNTGEVSWPALDVQGNVYHMCYCRSDDALAESAGGNPFQTTENGAAVSSCGTFSAYRVHIGTAFVTGPRSTDKPFGCSAGGTCAVTVEGVGTGLRASESILQASVIDLREVRLLCGPSCAV